MGPLTAGEQNRLIIEFVGLVRPIAAAFYSATSPPLEEMVSEGHLGLVKAAREFDPKRSEFLAFASHGIRQHILNFIRKWNNRELPIGLEIERDFVEWQIWPHVTPFECWTSLAATPEELLARYEHIAHLSAAFAGALLGFQPKNREMFIDRYMRSRTLVDIARKNKVSYHKVVRILDKMLRSINEIVFSIERRQVA